MHIASFSPFSSGDFFHYFPFFLVCYTHTCTLYFPCTCILTGPVFLGVMRGRVLLFLDEVDSGIVLSMPPPFLICLGERVGPRLPRLSCDGMPAIVNAPQLSER